jgi:hypothetical protein
LAPEASASHCPEITWVLCSLCLGNLLLLYYLASLSSRRLHIIGRPKFYEKGTVADAPQRTSG